ncbi:MAG: hypothetical protein Kow0075_10700 [Salibacteraceae bacterium]
MLALFGCESSEILSGRDVTDRYRLHPQGDIVAQYVVWAGPEKHVSVYWRIAAGSLQKSSPDATRSFLINYYLFNTFSDATYIDTGRVLKKQVSVGDEDYISGVIDLQLPVPRRYMLLLDIRDLNRVQTRRDFIELENPTHFTRQSFLVIHPKTGLIFKPYLQDTGLVKLKMSVPVSQLYAKYYHREFPAAAPPFVAVSPKPFDFTPDEVVTLLPDSADTWNLRIQNTGFYQITIDSTQKAGGTLYYFGEHYPKVKTPKDLLEPLRYITTSAEYTALEEAENAKVKVDEFWLKIGGSPARARELIAAYYSRVEEANELFVSYIEGWKTDRGMCFIVFGPPDKVYRTSTQETWFYGEEGKFTALKLTFTKVINPFTDNDFRLNRIATYRTPWFRAVDFWRQGRILKNFK